VQRLYRGELQVVDAALAQLLERLRTQRRLDDAIVVVVGIHGEEFYEHRGAGHGRTLYEESLRVPLMIRAPSLLDPRRVKSPVDLLDLAPTLADLVGAPKPDAWQGESLLPTLNDPEPPPRLVIGYLGDGSRAGIVGYSKLVLGPGHTEQFFDLNADPTELHDALATGGVELRIVRNALAWQLGYEQRWRRARWGTGANLSPAFAMDLGM
jgi:arylsulfatase A-like enzyme